MMQSVLLTAVRGPDGVRKYDPPKMLLRWYRRCILISALDQEIITNPHDSRGGSFTGPSLPATVNTTLMTSSDVWPHLMRRHEDDYIRDLDAISHHFQMHFMHAIHILGVYHPDALIRTYWKKLYVRLVHELHLNPETDEALARRLGDDREQWLERSDPATTN